MLYIEKNPEVVEAFLYLEEDEPEWFIQMKPKIVFIHLGRECIETAWGISTLNRAEYVCRNPNSTTVWVESKNQFEQKYKPCVDHDSVK
jgi:hypothetical protein